MTIQRFAIGFVLLLAAVAVSAQTPSTAAPAPGSDKGHWAPGRENDDFPALERFLTMDDEQLDRIQQAVAKVRAMTPAERAALHTQMHAFRQLPEAKREQMRAGWGWQSEQDRADWPSMMRSLPAAERAAIQSELQSLPPERRPARKHELLGKWRGAQNQP